MKKSGKYALLFFVLAVGLFSLVAGRVTAEVFTALHSFTVDSGPPYWTNADGMRPPHAKLTLAGNSLYGATVQGGVFGNGTVYKVNIDGSGFKTLYNFSAGNFFGSFITNTDGANCQAELILASSVLFGTTSSGGISGRGTVFALNSDGTGFTNLHNFMGAFDDGGQTGAGLVLAGGRLFGTTYSGGRSDRGTVFALNTDGTGYAILHDFTGGSDGGNPPKSLIISNNILYGVAAQGGTFGNGTVFALQTDGSGFTTLHDFTAGTNTSDGTRPHSTLILSGNTLYGTASYGGTFGNGTVFKLNTDGTGFLTLHSFGSDPDDGLTPEGSLVLSSKTVYGTTYGGRSGNGTVFAVDTDGARFATLYNFTPSLGAYMYFTNMDGVYPSGVILSGNRLYGATQLGGSSARGTVFSISFPPELTFVPSVANVTLKWPTKYEGFDYNGFTLQSTTNLASQVWTTSSSVPVVVNGQNTLTNPISGTRQFFRLSQ